MDDITRRAVRIDSEGLVSLRPFVDFRDPKTRLPAFEEPGVTALGVISSRALAASERLVPDAERRAPIPQRLPPFLQKRLSLMWIEPAGEA